MDAKTFARPATKVFYGNWIGGASAKEGIRYQRRLTNG
jgi:hypothetical protein